MPPKVKQMIKQQQEQAIFKEFEVLGWEIKKDEETGIIIFDNGGVRIIFYTFEKIYEWKYFTFKPLFVDTELHLRIHKLICLWGWI